MIETEDRWGSCAEYPRSHRGRVFLRETPTTVADKAIRDLPRSVGGGKEPSRQSRLSAAVDADRPARRSTTRSGSRTSTRRRPKRWPTAKGVCQDHAHVFISAARILGVPARYINGCFLSGTIAPSEAHHAWAEAWVEGLGWVGFDPANGMCPTERYLRLACGLDAASAALIRGGARGVARTSP